VLNSLNDAGAGFGKLTNKITFIDKDFNIEPLPLKGKEDVARDILQKVIEHYA
jgi:phosphopantothenoylcysteine decarboxylase/phosphopantothenate--cysteine ligase